ncbi:MAG TPA: TIM barrel protein [Cyclobacteriaceae bacterium]|nr:TIM barrel protein [Cyclobacteriaceae bacterium]
MIRIANAPCSWGALEFDLEHKPLGYRQVLDEMTGAGYAGTELGDWGFMPTDPKKLNEILVQKNLELLGAFVPISLANQEAHSEGIERALRTAKLMRDAGYREAFIVLADNNGSIPERTNHAGRIEPKMGLSPAQWKIFAKGAENVAREVKDKLGMRTVFHHHCAGYVETPAEVDMLMSLTDASLLGLCLDTGHYSFGGGDPVAALNNYYNRIWHVHFKDFLPTIGKTSHENNWNYFESVAHGVFCELGKGSVKFREIAGILRNKGYDGWIVVEQDVLPGMGEPKKSAAANRNYLKNIGL